MTANPIHLVVGTPCRDGRVTSATFSSLLQLQQACQKENLPLTLLMRDGGDLVEQARQEITDSFLAIPSATHLLFVDADIAFEPGQVFRLLRFNTEVTAAAYPLKFIDWERVRSAARAGGDKLESAGLHYAMGTIQPPQVRDGFIRVQWAGTGFFLVKREVFGVLAERHPELRYSKGSPGQPGQAGGFAFFNCLVDGKDGPYLSEDYSFCRCWTQMGGEIWVDLESRLRHVGLSVFAGDLASAHLEKGKEP